MPEPARRDRRSETQAPDVETELEPIDRQVGGCGGRAEAPGRGRHRKALLEPAILLTLLGDDTHGYELIEQVQDLVGDEVCVDPGSTYRMLRSMENDGLVASTWIITDHGPNRRAYAITPFGRQALAAGIAELRRRARILEALADTAEGRLQRHPHRKPPEAGSHGTEGVS